MRNMAEAPTNTMPTRRSSNLLLATLSLLVLLGGARAKNQGFSSKCRTLGSDDVVIAVCLQNDFFDERPVDGGYAKGAPLAYPIAEANKNGAASVRRGALAVGRSEEARVFSFPAPLTFIFVVS